MALKSKQNEIVCSFEFWWPVFAQKWEKESEFHWFLSLTNQNWLDQDQEGFAPLNKSKIVINLTFMAKVSIHANSRTWLLLEVWQIQPVGCLWFLRNSTHWKFVAYKLLLIKHNACMHHQNWALTKVSIRALVKI